MANVTSKDKQISIVSMLAEGCSLRAIERMTGTHRDTVMRLGVKIGKGCAAVLDAKMRNLDCPSFAVRRNLGIHRQKGKHLTKDDNPELGDVWTFCAVDAETKLVPSFKVGKRNLNNAFVQDVAGRLKNRVQISSDALRAYVDAVENTFGAEVDYGQVIKTYTHAVAINPDHRYSAPEIVNTEKRIVTGNPNMRLISTSYIERLNATTRLHMRRLTRLTLAFSKKLENFEAAVALHFAYYNLVKPHKTIRCTPAMEGGIERDFWSVGDLVEAATA